MSRLSYSAGISSHTDWTTVTLTATTLSAEGGERVGGVGGEGAVRRWSRLLQTTRNLGKSPVLETETREESWTLETLEERASVPSDS